MAADPRLKPVDRFKQCRKCGHIGEQDLRFRIKLGWDKALPGPASTEMIETECLVCGFTEPVPCADATGPLIINGQ